MSLFRPILMAIMALLMLSPLSRSLAEAATPAQQAAAVAQVAPAAGASGAASPAEGAKPLKSVVAGLGELSPWSMFLSADILVQAVMIGLAFASLLTWTIFIAKMVELSLARRRLRAAIARLSGAKSLADAQFVLGTDDSVAS